MLGQLFQQFLRDLKASWQKAAFLGVLLTVGMCFWVPPLFRMVMKEKPAAKPSVAKADVPVVPTMKLERSFQSSIESQASKSKFNWQTAQKISNTDPLVQSAQLAAIQSSPFQVDRDQFPPPIVFAEEPKEVIPTATKGASSRSREQALNGLVLKTTIVGVKRRAAYINNKLYFEGKEIRAGDESFLLTAVYPRKVILSQGSDVFELKIPDKTAAGNIDVGQDKNPSTQTTD